MSETDSEAAPRRAERVGGWREKHSETKRKNTAWCFTQNTTNSKVGEKDDRGSDQRTIWRKILTSTCFLQERS